MVSYLPLEQRIRLYGEVLQLHKQRLSYNEIMNAIYRDRGIMLNASHISFWLRGLKSPLGKVNKFDGKPSPELASVIGALLSDGNRYSYSGLRHRIWLGVKDRDYAESFGRDLAKVLARAKPYEPHWSKSQRRWIIDGYSILLYKFLDHPWQKLKPHIEHCKDCGAAFLRAFIDGEGSIQKRKLTVYNTNYELLRYVQSLLQRYFGIESTGPHRNKKAGYHFRSPCNGKIYKAKKACYKSYLRAISLPLFDRYIGFAIKRKQQRLAEAIQK